METIAEDRLYIYCEDGGKAKVRVVEDNSNDEWERYLLEVVEIIQDPWVGNFDPEGSNFSVEKRKGLEIANSAIWCLKT